MSYPGDVLSFIYGAVSDGGQAAREAVATEAREGDELEQIFWCYAALATFRQEGIDLIVDTALRGHKVKHKSAALTLLTTLARIMHQGEPRPAPEPPVAQIGTSV